ncbi:MAG: M24 family metallopeptidase [Anaerolineae bacterium]|nr:M24 family metallopeptidase [Anaerolineae bacterium]
MKSDLPVLMRERGLDALVVFGPDGAGRANAPFTYFVGTAHVTSGLVVVRQDGATFLVHSSMERDEAAKTGLQLVDRARYDYPELLRANNGDRLRADAALLQHILTDLGVAGRVAFYGLEQVNRALPLLRALEATGGCEVVLEYEQDIITKARATKDAYEIEQIRHTCRLTEQVMAETRAFLRSHRVFDRVLVQADGSPLTVGHVKQFVRREAAALGLELDDFIFAIGRDAGVPHSVGDPVAPVEIGKPIVFDLYPSGANGYHADLTRTWCLGEAPSHIVEAHALVLKALSLAESRFNADEMTYAFNEAVCELFESHGFPTLRQDAQTRRGYVHSLGHGFGLAVHESPAMSLKGWRPDEKLAPGSVFCAEPGLYDPDDARGGWGVRVEDDYYLDEAGRLCRLTTLERDLVVPL